MQPVSAESCQNKTMKKGKFVMTNRLCWRCLFGKHPLGTANQISFVEHAKKSLPQSYMGWITMIALPTMAQTQIKINYPIRL